MASRIRNGSGGGARRLPRPAQVGAPGHVGLQVPAHLRCGAAGPVALVEIVLQRLPEPRLLADLVQPAPDRVHVEGTRRQLMPAQPADPGPAAGTGPGVARTVPERLIDAVPRHVGELGQVAPQRGVNLAHEDQAGRDRPASQICGLLEEVEPGEVDPAQVGEVEGWLGQARPGGVSEPLAQSRHPVLRDLRPDRDANLVWHGKRPPGIVAIPSGARKPQYPATRPAKPRYTGTISVPLQWAADTRV